MLDEFNNFYSVDTKIFQLGKLCKNGHDFSGNGQSIRYVSNGRCIDCVTDTKPYIKREKPSLPQHLLEAFDSSKFYLGGLCKRDHNFLLSGNSLRYINGKHCAKCSEEYKRIYYKENRDTVLTKCAKYREENKDETSARNRKRYQENREHILKKQAEHRHENREFFREKAKEYYRNNKKRYNESAARYRQRKAAELKEKRANYYRLNKEIISKKKAEHRANNPEKERQRRKIYSSSPRAKAIKWKNEQKRRALKRQVYLVPFTLEQLESHFALFDNCCAYCGKVAALTIDHFIPISKAGPHCLGNIVPACTSCNSSKNCLDPKEWHESQPFYSKQRWERILKILGKTDYRQLPLL